MPSDDHWVDESYKKNSAFNQRRGDVQQRSTNVGMPAVQPHTATRTTMSNTQLRLAALPPQYQAAPQQTSAQQQSQRAYQPGYFSQSQQNTQPNYSQEYSQPDYSQPRQSNSQQVTQPDHSQQNVQPDHAQQQQQQQQQQYAQQQQHGYPHPFPNQVPQYPQHPQYAAPQQQQQQAAMQQQQAAMQQQYAQQQYAQQYAQQQQQQQYAQPPVEPVVRETIRELTDEQIDERAIYDSHTRSFNLRHTLRMLRQELVRANFFGRSVSLLIVSIDNYDQIVTENTIHAADKAADAVSRALLQFGRPIDVVGRYTDSRFMIVCPEMDKEQSTELAEKIRQVCEAIVVAHDWKNVKLSASIGIASLSQECDDVESFIALADLGADMVGENGGNGVFFVADSI